MPLGDDSMRRALAGTLAAFVVFSAGGRAEIIDGYTSARHDRFAPGTFPLGTPPTPNPSFYLSALDFSGVGWIPAVGPGTFHVSMISPTHFVAATHVSGTYTGATMAFRAKDGSFLTRMVTSLTQVGGSDVMVGTLNAALPTGVNGVANYDIPLAPSSLYLNNDILMYGQRSRVGRNRGGFYTSIPASGTTTALVTDYDPAGDGDGFGYATPFPVSPPTDEFTVELGDSGSPTFFPHAGALFVLGIHSAEVTSPFIGSADAFLPAYVNQIAAATGLPLSEFTAVVPEPTSLVLVSVGAVGLWWKRRRSRA